MHLKSLAIDSFKNLANQKVEFNAGGITILLGPNGQGKTNFLEAIRMLAIPKPLRSRKLTDCIATGGNHFRIESELGQAKVTNMTMAIQARPAKRIFTLDFGEVEIKEFIGNLQVVLFTPDDLNLLTGSPSLRRRWLDSLLAQTDPAYFVAISRYYHAMRQRNALLKQLYHKPGLKPELRIWNQKLAEAMLIILTHRQELMSYCTERMATIYQNLAENNDELAVAYQQTLSDLPPTLEQILRKLTETEADDIRYGYTQIGPHREEWEISINQQSAKVVASRGELRTMVLALKMLEIAYLENKSGHKPLLLLDDVFSELDRNRRHQLLAQAKNQQTIITTVEPSYFQEIPFEYQLLAVENGQITDKLL